MMEVGWLEIGLLCLSTSTFIVAMFLLFWVMVKGGYQMCIEDPENEKSDIYSGYYRPSSPSDMQYYPPVHKPPVEVHITTPDGSTVSEHTREHILNSHPHFWDNVSGLTGKQGTYGSFKSAEDKKICISLESLLDKEYTYATVILHFIKDAALEDYIQLFSIETDSLSFNIRDIYIELHCQMLPQDPIETEKLLQEIHIQRKASKSILNRLRYNTKQKLDAFNINVPLSKMRKALKMTRKLLFPLQQSKTDKERFQPEITATCYMIRNGNKVYIGKGDVIEVIGDEHTGGSEDGADDTAKLQTNYMEVKLDFIHEPKIKQGRALLSLTYLPTAEKLTVDIKEFMLEYDKEKMSESTYSGLYWRITYHRSGKRRSKRKLNISLSDQSQFIWTCDTVASFDRVTPDSVSSSFIICKLMSNKASPEELSSPVLSSETDSSPTRADNEDVSSSKKENVFILGEVYVGCNVADSSCRDHWYEMLKTPRLQIEKMHDVF